MTCDQTHPELLQINELRNMLFSIKLYCHISWTKIMQLGTKSNLHGLFCLKWASDLPLTFSSSSQAVRECKLELFLSTHHKHRQSVSGKNWHAAHDSCGETQAFIKHCAVCWTGDIEQQRCFYFKIINQNETHVYMLPYDYNVKIDKLNEIIWKKVSYLELGVCLSDFGPMGKILH